MNQNFKVGEKVVAVETTTKPFGKITAGQTYVVTNVRYCEACGIQAVAIGQISPGVYNSKCFCGTKKLNQLENWWHSGRFTRPISLSSCIEYKLKVSLPELVELKELQNQ